MAHNLTCSVGRSCVGAPASAQPVLSKALLLDTVELHSAFGGHVLVCQPVGLPAAIGHLLHASLLQPRDFGTMCALTGWSHRVALSRSYSLAAAQRMLCYKATGMGKGGGCLT